MKTKIIASTLMTILLTFAVGQKSFAQKRETKNKKVANLPPPPPPPPAKTGEKLPAPRAPKDMSITGVEQKHDKRAQAAEPANAPFATK